MQRGPIAREGAEQKGRFCAAIAALFPLLPWQHYEQNTLFVQRLLQWGAVKVREAL